MKTYKDYLIDFDSLKVGTKLWSSKYGNCIVIHICNISEYTIEVAFDDYPTNTYTKDGKEFKSDKFASLFKEKPDFFKEKKEVKKWIWFYEYLDCYGVTQRDLTDLMTEKDFLEFYGKVDKHEKIDCTEKTEVTYE